MLDGGSKRFNLVGEVKTHGQRESAVLLFVIRRHAITDPKIGEIRPFQVS